jgi:hypothetical protein
MRLARPASRTAFAIALSVGPLVACNALWGIDSPTLAGDGGALDGSIEGSPPPGDGRAPDATRDGGNTDAPPSDGHAPDSPGIDAPSYFDGHCAAGGHPVVLAADPNRPEYVVVDEGGVYWTSFNTGTLALLRFGSAPTVRSVGDGGMEYPQGIAVAAGEVVWVASGLGTVFECSAATGCTSVHSLAVDQPGTDLVAANASFAFWNTNDTISACSLPDCTTPVVIAHSSSYSGLALDAEYLYWSDGSSTIYSTLLSGGGAPQAVVTTESSPTWLTVANGSLYWSFDTGVRTCTLAAGLCNSFPSTLVGNIEQPSRLAVDDVSVYFTDPSLGTLGKAPLDGGAPDASGLAPFYMTPQISSVAVNDSCVFWAMEGDGGAIMAAPK